MSSQKDERKAQAREERAIDKAIEETKDNAGKIIREVSRDLPANTATFHEYQEQYIRATREMTNDFLDSQKEVAKSLQSAYRPVTNNGFVSAMFWPITAMNPLAWTENYVRAATSFADMTMAAVRLQNDLTTEVIESSRLFNETARRNTKELDRLGVENARTVERMSHEAYGTSAVS